MFSVKCLGAIDSSVRSLDRGTCFGFLEQPILFQVGSSLVSTPLIIKFFLKEDPTQNPVSFLIGGMEDDDVLNVTFFNVKKGSSGGLVEPADIIKFDDKKLSLIFTVDRTLGAGAYMLTYEFFEVTDAKALI